jgi:aldehyde dehydrogenase (NAD+)
LRSFRRDARIANGSVYGLAAGVWSQDIGRCPTMASRLEAGTVWINTYRVSSYLSPFGGYKRSGFGRESGLLAIREYLQEKSVWIDTIGETPDPFVTR